MAASSFRSTSKRGTFTSSSVSSGKECRQEDPGRRQQGRRSKSVNPVSKQMVQDSTAASSFSKRDNPLFNSPSLSPPESDRFIGAAKSDDRVSDGRRGRTVTRGPGWSGGGGNFSSTRQGIGRSLSRVDTGRKRRSISRGPCIETEREKEQLCSLDSAMRSKPTAGFEPGRSHHNSGLRLNRLTRNSPSEAARCQTHNVFGGSDAIQRMNQAYMSDADMLDHPPELICPDAVEIIRDLRRKYTSQYEQSEERIRKLQADLDAEERRRQELSRILFDVLPDPKISTSHRLKRKESIERREMSKRLTDEAFNYFDECVSISTFDGSDFSFDDPVSSSVHPQVSSHPVNGVSRASDIEIPITPHDRQEGAYDQSQCFLSSSDSNVTTTNSISSISYHNQILGGALSPKNGSHQFSLVGEEIQQLIKKSERQKLRGAEKIGRSGENPDPFEFSNVQMLAEMVLYDRVAFRRERDFGGLLLCDFKVI